MKMINYFLLFLVKDENDKLLLLFLVKDINNKQRPNIPS